MLLIPLELDRTLCCRNVIHSDIYGSILHCVQEVHLFLAQLTATRCVIFPLGSNGQLLGRAGRHSYRDSNFHGKHIQTSGTLGLTIEVETGKSRELTPDGKVVTSYRVNITQIRFRGVA